MADEIRRNQKQKSTTRRPTPVSEYASLVYFPKVFFLFLILMFGLVWRSKKKQKLFRNRILHLFTTTAAASATTTTITTTYTRARAALSVCVYPPRQNVVAPPPPPPPPPASLHRRHHPPSTNLRRCCHHRRRRHALGSPSLRVTVKKAIRPGGGDRSRIIIDRLRCASGGLCQGHSPPGRSPHPSVMKGVVTVEVPML